MEQLKKGMKVKYKGKIGTIVYVNSGVWIDFEYSNKYAVVVTKDELDKIEII
jgi:ribosomal protein L9